MVTNLYMLCIAVIVTLRPHKMQQRITAQVRDSIDCSEMQADLYTVSLNTANQLK